MARRQERHRRRAERRQFVRRLLFGPWLPRHTSSDEEEKEAMLQHHEEETSMEEELASCRRAADVVGDIVAAEEGRGLLAAQDRTVAVAGHVEMSVVPQSGFAPYMEDEEEELLPAYDERSDSSVADGLRYTPGSSAYTPSSVGSDELGDRKD
ncbi:hypothetical protein CONLIGDRAFT_678923 [Coniochaeta ligniaria NRRL 30616]|uniref:Uncharacterized protein n=1 Tax=Coniochaeta ligniaria NRRL 30616 TaxID=1408157 RepID=A0A1J7IZ30_9PEZI|nr:hypothetical protein CONLIGDRAFT_678923 [Coniochaeta ligniaria NRRL 30616]